MNICLFTAEEASRPLSVHDARAEHIIKVLHKKVHDTFVAGIIDGGSGVAVIDDITEEQIHFTFTPQGDGKPLLPLVLLVGFPRPIQLRRLLRDAASLGVREVHLTGTALGDKSYMKSTLLARGEAERMLLDGVAQAGGTYVPRLFLHQTLCEGVDAVAESEHLIALDNVRPAMTLTDFLRAHPLSASGAAKRAQYAAAIGAERGWTDAERDMMTERGYTLCSMGERILRTETAACAACAIILADSRLWNTP